MKIFPSVQALGFFDVELRMHWLEVKGNPLSRLEGMLDWEGFRTQLRKAVSGGSLDLQQ
jgi:hypothetical protein